MKKHNVRLELDDDSHAKLRLLAASRGKPMAQLAREVVEELLSKYEVKNEKSKVRHK